MSVSRVRVCVHVYGCECERACTCASVLGGGRASRGGACVKDPGEERAGPDVTAVTRGLGDWSLGLWEQVAFGRRFQVGELEVTLGATRGFQQWGLKWPHVHPQMAHGGERVKGHVGPWQAAGRARGAAAVAFDPNQTGSNCFVGGSDGRGAEKWVSRVLSRFLISSSIFVPLAACLGLHPRLSLHHFLPPNCPLLRRLPLRPHPPHAE